MSMQSAAPAPRLTGRIPPHNQQAEQSVLGCAMAGQRPLAEITAILKTDDFYRPDHQLIYETICDLYMGSKPVDIITVSDALESKGLLEKSGGLAYISSLLIWYRWFPMRPIMPIWFVRNLFYAV